MGVAFGAPPRLSLQTPASDRVNYNLIKQGLAEPARLSANTETAMLSTANAIASYTLQTLKFNLDCKCFIA